jgi:hypothetical protein
MAISSKDLESLWQRYKAEAVPAGISVNQFFESNGVPYHVFEKWYKKKFQAPNVVECVVAGAPDSTSAVPTPSKQGNPSAGFLQLRPRMPLSSSMSILGLAMV